MVNKSSNMGESVKFKGSDYDKNYFATDPEAIDYLFEQEPFDDMKILEPCCGGGHLAERMKE